MMAPDTIYCLVDTSGKLKTGYWTTLATATVMKGRLEKAGATGVIVRQDTHGAIDDRWEPAPFDAEGWAKRWSSK